MITHPDLMGILAHDKCLWGICVQILVVWRCGFCYDRCLCALLRIWKDFPDLGSQPHILKRVVTIFSVKLTIIGSNFFPLFKSKIIFNFETFLDTKKGRTADPFHPPFFAVVGSGIRDKHLGFETFGKIRARVNHRNLQPNSLLLCAVTWF
jgi:hypothetical protein